VQWTFDDLVLLLAASGGPPAAEVTLG